MRKTRPDPIRADIVETQTLIELSTFCHARTDWVVALVHHGVLDPGGPDTETWRFDATNIARARKAQRLMQDFGLSVAGLALVLDLMDERDALAQRLAHLSGEMIY